MSQVKSSPISENVVQIRCPDTDITYKANIEMLWG